MTVRTNTRLPHIHATMTMTYTGRSSPSAAVTRHMTLITSFYDVILRHTLVQLFSFVVHHTDCCIIQLLDCNEIKLMLYLSQ